MLPACCTIMPFGHRFSQVTEVIARYLSDFPLAWRGKQLATNIALTGLGYFFKSPRHCSHATSRTQSTQDLSSGPFPVRQMLPDNSVSSGGSSRDGVFPLPQRAVSGPFVCPLHLERSFARAPDFEPVPSRPAARYQAGSGREQRRSTSAPASR